MELWQGRKENVVYDPGNKEASQVNLMQIKQEEWGKQQQIVIHGAFLPVKELEKAVSSPLKNRKLLDGLQKVGGAALGSAPKALAIKEFPRALQGRRLIHGNRAGTRKGETSKIISFEGKISKDKDSRGYPHIATSDQ